VAAVTALDWPLMPVDVDIEHVARLARLRLDDDEVERLRAQLGLILQAAAKVREVATDDVPPTAYAVPRANVLRPDEPDPSLPREEALANAPEQEGGLFRVPRILEAE
jgi:aspartyl-tRNA(Asn)/glutamyl-tRNA(Gln) amidotransferase subunit C